MLKPLNDLCKIEIETDEYGFGGNKADKADSGILVELPDVFTYFGFWSFAFENSFMDIDKLKVLHNHYSQFIGQRVYWTALSEKGNMLKQDDKTYVFVKLTSLIASDENTDNPATSVLDSSGGSFSA